MSTAAAPALAPDASTTLVPKPKTALTASRGAWYLLEGVFQRSEPFTSPDKMVAAAKFWLKLQSTNEALAPDGSRFDKKIIKSKTQTDLEFAVFAETREQQFKTWAQQSLTIKLSKKQEKLCDDAIDWALKNRDKGLLPQSSEHLLSLLTAFGVGQTDEGDSADDE